MEYFNSITEAMEDIMAPNVVFEAEYYNDFTPCAYTSIKAVVEVYETKVKGTITFTSMETNKYEYTIEGEEEDVVHITTVICKKFLNWCNEAPMED